MPTESPFVFFVAYWIISLGAFLSGLSFLLFSYAISKTSISWLRYVMASVSPPFFIISLVYLGFELSDTTQDVRSIIGRLVLAFLFYFISFLITVVSIMIIRDKP